MYFGTQRTHDGRPGGIRAGRRVALRGSGARGVRLGVRGQPCFWCTPPELPEVASALFDGWLSISWLPPKLRTEKFVAGANCEAGALALEPCEREPFWVAVPPLPCPPRL